MDVASTLLGSIIVSICIFPFVAVQVGSKKKKKHVINTLNQMAQNRQCQISTVEQCGDYAIGLDEVNQMAFFVKKNDEVTLENEVDLKHVVECYAHTQSKTIRSGQDKKEIITQVELSFKHKTHEKKLADFILYSENFNAQLGNEYPMAQKWAKILNNHLS